MMTDSSLVRRGSNLVLVLVSGLRGIHACVKQAFVYIESVRYEIEVVETAV